MEHGHHANKVLQRHLHLFQCFAFQETIFRADLTQPFLGTLQVLTFVPNAEWLILHRKYLGHALYFIHKFDANCTHSQWEVFHGFSSFGILILRFYFLSNPVSLGRKWHRAQAQYLLFIVTFLNSGEIFTAGGANSPQNALKIQFTIRIFYIIVT